MTDTPIFGGDLQDVISGNTTYEDRSDPSVAALSGGGYVIAWVVDPDGPPTANGTEIRVQRFNADGSENGPAISVNTTLVGDQVSPAVAGLTGGSFVVTWFSEDTDTIFTQRYDANGVPLGAETVVSTPALGDVIDSAVTPLATGGYAVAWTQAVDNQNGTYTVSVIMQRYNASGVPQGVQTVISSELTTFSPGLGSTDISYEDLQITQLTGGNIVLSWTSVDYPAPHEPQIAVVTSTGVAVSAAQNPQQTAGAMTTALPQQDIVALGNGNFLVVYGYHYGENGLAGVGYGEVYGRIYNASGIAVGNEFAIASGTLNRRFDISVGSDGQGGAIVTWVLEHDTLNEHIVEAQHVSATGDLIGETIHVFPLSYDQEKFFDIAALTTGEIVIAGHTGGSASDIVHRLLHNGTDVRFTTGDDIVLLANTGETVAGLEGIDRITGGSGKDFIFGGSGNDVLNGGGNNDALFGGTGIDTLRGGNGDDLIFGNADGDIIDGQANNDTIDGGTGDDTIEGGTGNDVIYGGEGSDTINGGDNDDIIYGHRPWTMDLHPGEVGRDENHVNILNGGAGLDTIYGGGGNDIIDGGDGTDALLGGDGGIGPSGDDWFIASNGNDTVNGMDGFDTIDFSVLNREILMFLKLPGQSAERLAAKIAGGGGQPNYEQDLYDIEHFIGSSLGDSLLGAGGGNVLEGRGGTDLLFGEGGSDWLAGGDGVDQASGGSDLDWFAFDANANNTNDRVNDYQAGEYLFFANTAASPTFQVVGADLVVNGVIVTGQAGTDVTVITQASGLMFGADLGALAWQVLGGGLAALAAIGGAYTRWTRDGDNSTTWSTFVEYFTGANLLDYTWTYYDPGQPYHSLRVDHDQDGTQNWSSTEFTYSSAGVLDFKWTWYDAGQSYHSSKTDYDQDSAATWSTIVSNYSAMNVLDLKWTYYDAGQTYFAIKTDYDQASATNWDTIVTYYKTAGVIDWKLTTYDPGELYHSIKNDYDQDGTQTWDNIVTYYSAANVQDFRWTYWDAGQPFHSSKTDYDQSNAGTWNNIVYNYAAPGVLDNKWTYYDAGQTYYAILTDYDQAANQTWTTILTYYKTAGVTDWRLVTYDAGQPSHSKKTDYDQDSAFGWETIDTFYSAANVADYRWTYWDAGGALYATWIDYDQANTETWDQHVIEYSAPGIIANEYYI